MDDNDGLIFDVEEPAEKQQDIWNMRELTIFAIDCTEPMFNFSGEPFFKLCMKCLKSVYMNKVIGMSNDLIGIVFFGTDSSDPDQNLQHIRTFCEPKPSDADNVKKIENFIQSYSFCNFTQRYGHNDGYSLSDVLWHCSLLINKCNVKVRTKKIVIMTCNDDPHKKEPMKQHQARKKAEDLEGLGISLDLIPFGSSFDGELFFKEILKIANGQDTELPDGEYRIQELLERTYRKDYKKRSIAKLELKIGNDIRIGVDMYNFYRRLNIPSIMKLDRRSNEPLKSVVQTYNTETGERLLKSDLNKCVEIAHRRIKFDTEENNKLNMSGKRGLTLLGFKSMAYLQPEYHFKDPSFIYPSDEVIKGSKTLFVALLEKCLEKQKFALCYFVTRDQGRSNLVALVPQPEKREGNTQIMPPGFHLIFLPYADNIREIPLNEKAPINDDQVELCKRIIKKLTFKYDPQKIENPKVQHHWANIEALALNQEKHEVTDDTLCDYEFVSQRLSKLEPDFQSTFYPPDYDPETELSKKRKYPTNNTYKAKAPKMPKFDPSDPLYVEKMTEAGLTDKLTVPVLKQYLMEKGVSINSKFKKNDLLSCLNDILNNGSKN